MDKGLDFHFDFDFDFKLVGGVSLASSQDRGLQFCGLYLYIFLVCPILINKVIRGVQCYRGEQWKWKVNSIGYRLKEIVNVLQFDKEET